MARVVRPDWAWDNYDNWRRLAENGHNEFEGCGWFQSGDAWCRQNSQGQRVSVHSNGQVECTAGYYRYT